MQEYTREQPKEELKLLFQALKEALVILRGFLVALVAVLITLVEAFIKYVSEARSSNVPVEIGNENLTEVVEPRPGNTPGLNINHDSETMTQENQINRYFYPFLALISTFSFVIGVAMIRPISQWAGSQVECVEKTLMDKDIDLEQSVKICNGGHD